MFIAGLNLSQRPIVLYGHFNTQVLENPILKAFASKQNDFEAQNGCG
jgi:hypothetical protein